ncbi:M48 family metallopeptidase [Kosakonia sacchari]|uniref:M48 family metallopeptidase n=1 Tax=Kosakonia sacchari TaxID=1158459 RepID=UPI0030C12C75
MDKKSLLYCFGVPLILFFYACWQNIRINEVDVYQVTQYGFVGHSVFADMSRQILAKAGMLFSLLGLFASTSAVILCVLSVRKARISAEKLIAAFTLCRKLLPFIMVGVMASIGFALVCVLLYEVCWIYTLGRASAFNIKLVIFVLLIIGSLVFMVLKSLFLLKRCFALFEPQDMQVHGAAVSEADAPELWRWVRELAQRGQAIVPDNIVVGLFEGFYVTASPVQIENGARLTGNTLYFPLSYAAFMNKDEVAAVIGHELGHFSGNDTVYTLHFAGLYAGMENSLDYFYRDVASSGWLERLALNPTIHLGLWFYRQFHETVNGWSRVRELAADTAGARTSSPQALAASLLRFSALNERFNAPMELFFNRKLETHDLVHSLFASLREGGRFDVAASLEQELAHPTDSHPPTRVRIEQLNVPLDETLLARASRPADEADYQWMRSLFRDASALSAALTAGMASNVEAHHDAYQAELENLAAHSTESVVVSLRKKNFWLFLVLAVLCVSGAGLVLALSIQWNATANSSMEKIIFGLVAGGLIFGLASWTMYTRVRQPLFTLTAQGIESYQLSAPLLLAEIENIDIRSVNEWVFIDLYWREGYQPPTCTVGRLFRSFTFEPKKNKVVISLPGGVLKGAQREKMSIEELYVALHEYIQAAWARRELNHS